MYGYVAVTHQRWFQHLAVRGFWEEVNFWRPSAHHGFNGPPGSPFFFKLKSPANALGGFGLVARFARLPGLAGMGMIRRRQRRRVVRGNGAATQRDSDEDNFIVAGPVPQIGCILLSSAVFFPEEMWIPQPSDWAPRNLTYQRYDLEQGEGNRIWRECQERLQMLRGVTTVPFSLLEDLTPDAGRFGQPYLIRPRLGQGTFRVAVTDAYGRACAVTGEHSLPALEAAHIRPYKQDGPHEVSNGLLLRADLHRLVDQGYVTVTADFRLRVGQRLREDYANGKTYYPFDNSQLSVTRSASELPSGEFLAWHNEHVFRG